MSDIFISYSQEDFSKARSIANALEKSGWSVWWDRKIPAGRNFNEYIKEQLNGARCVIVLWSQRSVNSEWVLDEASNAKKKNVLVPILIENVEIPYGFGQTQAANLIDWNGKLTNSNFSKLVNDIKLKLNDEQVPKPQNPESKSEKIPSQKVIASSKYRILISLLIFVLPWALGLLLGKRFFGGDKNMPAYFFTWTAITVVATIIGWSKKKLFEKLILIISAGVLLALAINFVDSLNQQVHQENSAVDSAQPMAADSSKAIQ